MSTIHHPNNEPILFFGCIDHDPSNKQHGRLKDNPDFKLDDEELWHPCYIALHREMKPWLFAQCNDDAEYVALWALLLAAAKEWFPDKGESKAGRSFCYRIEAADCISWHGWEPIQPVLEDYLRWCYGKNIGENDEE